jgi:uncharacterized phage protein (TIGR02220 family)/predicted phage replisome organizer
MADVKWIKITTDIFDDEKILLIESLPDAYAIITVWFKLLCLAGKQNNSGVFMMNNRVAYTDKMLATIFRMKETTVQLALQTFEQFGMIEIIDGVITIPNWGKHQNLDQMENRKEFMRNYMKEYRAKQKALTSGDECKPNCKPNSKPNVRQTEEEREEEKEEDRERELYISVVTYLNERVGTNYRASSKKTKSCIHARLEEGFTLDDFKTVIDKKANEWIGTEYEQYLRPETLFGTKFESYLNANIRKPQAFRQGYHKQTKAEELNDFYKTASEWAEL